MTTTLEILRQARDLLSDESRWTTEAYARNSEGRSLLFPGAPQATCFCMLGALRKVSGLGMGPGSKVLECAAELFPPKHDSKVPPESMVVEFNDTRTHPEVLDLFDRTIQRLEQGEKQCTNSTVLNSES